MKFFKRKEQNVNPASKELVDSTMIRLNALGITDTAKQAQCTNRMFQLTLTFVKDIANGKKRGNCNIDELSARYSDDMKTALAKYGVTDNEKQDEILNWFVSRMMEENQ